MHKPFIKKAVDSAVKIMVESYEDGSIDMELGDAIFTISYKRELYEDRFGEYYTCISVQNVVCTCGNHKYPNISNGIWDYFESIKDKIYPA